MTTYFELHNVLYQLQHGVRHGRFCETQLLELTTTRQANLNATAQTDLVIMDFSKAFDKVCHNKLLAKLDFYGVRSDILHWISCFLGEQSPYPTVLSGVPQGSIIGPILFLVYIFLVV
jgi:hypothetical protein